MNESTLPSASKAGTVAPNHSPHAKRRRLTKPKGKCIFPVELLERILAHTETTTLSKLMPVSRMFYSIAAPYLYRHVTITTENASKVIMGLARATHRRISTSPPTPSRPSRTKHLPDRPVALFWPEVPLESDDEDEDAPPNLSVYPSINSQQRKLHLLTLCETLDIRSIPNTRLSTELASRKTSLFPNCKRCMIGGRAIYQWADWRDRNRVGSLTYLRHEHPLLLNFEAFASPESFCLTLPTLNEETCNLYRDFRMRVSDGYLDKTQHEARLQMSVTSFKKLAYTGIDDVLQQLAFLGGDDVVKRIFIHNVRNNAVPHSIVAGNATVFFRSAPCECGGDNLQCFDPVQIPSQDGCFQHIYQLAREGQLSRHAQVVRHSGERAIQYPTLPNYTGKWRLVNAPVIILEGGRSLTKEIQEAEVIALEERMKLKFTTWTEDQLELLILDQVEPCECCGLK